MEFRYPFPKDGGTDFARVDAPEYLPFQQLPPGGMRGSTRFRIDASHETESTVSVNIGQRLYSWEVGEIVQSVQ